MGEWIRWIFRLGIPSAMAVWGSTELYKIWAAGWVWHGWHSAIALAVTVIGILWLYEDLPEFFKSSKQD